MLGVKEKVQTKNAKIVYIDPKMEFPDATKANISKLLKEIYLKNSVPAITKEGHTWIVYLIDRFSTQSFNELEGRLQSYNQEKSTVLLVSKEAIDKEVFHFLSLPINGIVSLSYLQNNYQIIMNALVDKRAFLEPEIHRDLSLEIENKKMRFKPIKKLMLNKEKVAGILTEREHAILELILDGNNNSQIAEKLYFAHSTVTTVISSILKKIGANDRTDAMVKAIRNGWVDAQR